LERGANEPLSKDYRFVNIKATAQASIKPHTCISLKQRGNSLKNGLACNLVKQVAETKLALHDIFNFAETQWIIHNH